jgi:hypothetical protein
MGENSFTLKPSEALELGKAILANLVRYPLSLRKKVFWSGEPQCWFGLTDHPLDRDGGPISDPFTTLRKLFTRKASCVLRSPSGREGEIPFSSGPRPTTCIS